MDVDPGEENNLSANKPQIVEEIKRIMIKDHEQSEVFSFAYKLSE